MIDEGAEVKRGNGLPTGTQQQGFSERSHCWEQEGVRGTLHKAGESRWERAANRES